MGETELIRMTIAKLAALEGVSDKDAFEQFYHSKTFEELADKNTGLFTYTPYSLAQMVIAEG
jgi:hypothetical protein